MTVTEQLAEVFADAGVRGWLHACSIRDPAAEVDFAADEAVPLASLYKLVVLAAYARAVDAGALSPTSRTTLRPERRTQGPTGTASLHDAVTLSWRDAATLMVSVSDNAAADALVALLGLRWIAETAADLGLDRTSITEDSGGQLRALLRDTSTRSAPEAYHVLGDLDRAVEPSAYNPLLSSASTAREISRLLAAFWTDTAASPEQCAFARHALGQTFGPHRLRLGFPHDDVTLAHKTGTIGALRHDAGVVRFAGEPPYAVSVMTRAARPDRILPRADAAIGAAARIAVDALRFPTDPPRRRPAVRPAKAIKG